MVQIMEMDDAARKEMGKRGREKMQHQFDISHVIRIYDDAIRRYVVK
jgi:hypothetical protein